MRKLIIIGAGGLGKEVAWTALEMNRSFSDIHRWALVGYADDKAQLKGTMLNGVPVIGAPEDVDTPESTWFHCAIGVNRNRKRLAQRCLNLGMKPASIIHPTVLTAPTAALGEGVYIGAYSIINPNAEIGDFVLINQRVAIGHDCGIGDFAQANPGAQINGACQLDEETFIGSNASLHPQVTVGRGAIVGSNSQVLRDVPPHTTANGVPALIKITH